LQFIRFLHAVLKNSEIFLKTNLTSRLEELKKHETLRLKDRKKRKKLEDLGIDGKIIRL